MLKGREQGISQNERVLTTFGGVSNGKELDVWVRLVRGVRDKVTKVDQRIDVAHYTG